MLEADPFARLYIIETDTRAKRGRIKVGYTTNPTQRLKIHRAVARAHGCRAGGHYASPAGSGSQLREDTLIQFCKEQPGARQFCREYFTGVSLEVAAEFTARLCNDEAWLCEAFRAAIRRAVAPGRVLCSLDEAARLLSTSQEALQEFVDAGLLRVIQVGGRSWRVRIDALEDIFKITVPYLSPVACLQGP